MFCPISSLASGSQMLTSVRLGASRPSRRPDRRLVFLFDMRLCCNVSQAQSIAKGHRFSQQLYYLPAQRMCSCTKGFGCCFGVQIRVLAVAEAGGFLSSCSKVSSHLHVPTDKPDAGDTSRLYSCHSHPHSIAATLNLPGLASLLSQLAGLLTLRNRQAI